MTKQAVKESARVLLSALVDYAGLFPPAQLSMSKAVSNYAAYKTGDYSWMLGRFILPVSRLDEFTESARGIFPNDKTDLWRLSVLADEDIQETVRKTKDFNRGFSSKAVCDTLEIKANDSLQIEEIIEFVPPEFTNYFELPLTKNLEDSVATLALKNGRAKIRTGGVTANAFPSAAQIMSFMQTCIAAKVPLKATAGLHHPLRCTKPLTYERDAPTGAMHGFLNVFLAAGFLQQGYKPSLIEELLEDESAENFLFDDNGVLWREEYFLSTEQLKNLRERGAVSFGSCSFEEPIQDLQETRIL